MSSNPDPCSCVLTNTYYYLFYTMSDFNLKNNAAKEKKQLCSIKVVFKQDIVKLNIGKKLSPLSV